MHSLELVPDRSPPPGARSSRWMWRVTIGLLLAIILLPAVGVGYYAFLIQRRIRIIERLEEGPYFVVHNRSDRNGQPWVLPRIWEISLTTPFADRTELMIEDVVQCPELVRLSWSGGSIGDDDVRMLRRLRNLKSLELEATDISDDALEVIGQLPALRKLDLSATRVTDRAVDALAAMPMLQRVRLQHSRISQAAADKLRQSRPELEVVHVPAQGAQQVEAVREIIKRGGLVSERKDNPAVAALMLEFRSQFADWNGMDWSLLKHIPSVEFVRLSGFERPDEIVASLADLSGVRTLVLVGCPVDLSLMKRIVASPKLEALVLDGCDLMPAQLELLAGLEQLQDLRLGDNVIDAAGMSAIVSLPKLTKVNFRDCKFTDGLFEAVALPQHWESLEIYLGNLTDRDVEQIVRCQGLNRLSLISHPEMTEISIDRALTLPRLEQANIRGDRIPYAAEDRLQAALQKRRAAQSGLPAGK
ncbi:MAG TPA: hypothetical protein VMP01_18320 [Pirellulaceae bacterium]|nr:hypothetical protein [Pirellulaceae bacterium]